MTSAQPHRPLAAPRADQPWFFAPNRVWRCYTGGALLDRFLDRGAGDGDGYFPEEWLASSVPAENGEHTQGPDEGLSRLRAPDGGVGAAYRDAPADQRVDVLCKFLDSAVRLPIQCHPDQAFARRHYGSEHGKTESWLILDTRTIDGVEPYLLIGFRPGVTAEAFARAVHAQDVAALEGMLNRIPVRAGDAYLIPGRVPHAIGPGVLMLEVQEPSDWVVQVERTCAGTRLSDGDMWGPVAPEVGLACFDYRGEPVDALRARLALRPTVVASSPTAVHERLRAVATTDAFAIDRLRLTAPFRFAAAPARHIGIVTAGSGRLVADGAPHALRRGDCYVAPAGVRDIAFEPAGAEPLVVHVVTGG